MVSLVLWTVLGLSSPAFAADEPYVMGDLNASLVLPKGWEQLKWSDWELQAKSKDGLLFHLFKTDFQPDLTEETVKGFADSYTTGLENQGFSDLSTTNAALTEVAGHKAGFIRTSLTIPKVGRGTAVTVVFAGKGMALHARIIATAANAAKAEATLTRLIGDLQISAGPAETSPEVAAKSGLGATLPAGWRGPLPEEMEAVQKVTALIGQPEVDLEKCWVGLRPPTSGDPDILLTCKAGPGVGPIDEHSFSGVEATLHDRYFGKLTEPVPQGEAMETADRHGLLFRVKGGKKPIRLMVMPMENTLTTTWALSNGRTEADLDADLKALAGAMRFPGKDNGAPLYGVGEWMDYYMDHRPTHPYVLVPGALLLLGLVGGGMALRKVAKGG